jgi:hypothetical protein
VITRGEPQRCHTNPSVDTTQTRRVGLVQPRLRRGLVARTPASRRPPRRARPARPLHPVRIRRLCLSCPTSSKTPSPPSNPPATSPPVTIITPPPSFPLACIFHCLRSV